MKNDFQHHSGGVIHVEHSARWGAVPEPLLEDARIGLDARAVAAWLAVKPAGWLISVKVLRKRIMAGSKPLGRDRWQRIARELEDAGYLKRKKINGDGGHWVWHVTFNPIPQATMTGFAGPGSADGGQAGTGNPGHKVVPTAVNTMGSNTTTNSDDSSLTDLIEAAVWKEKRTRGVRNEAAFRRVVGQRLSESPSQEDLITLKEWCAHCAQLASEQSKEEEKAAATPTSKEEGRKRMAALRASMTATQRAQGPL